MAVIIREEQEIAGKKFNNVKFYLSDKRGLTQEEKERAEKLDQYIESALKNITNLCRSNGLLALKGKSGVIALWHFVGQRIAEFVDDVHIVLPEDRKYIWRALWDHSGELAPGEKENRSRKAGSFRDHWHYCYMISRYSLGQVTKAGNWRAWVEFLDSPWTRNDERIPEWISRKMSNPPCQNWLRKFTPSVRNALRNVHTSVLTQEELDQRLDKLWAETFP
jgi:hypothetical protein